MIKIAMVAGEASSDQLAAHLIGALKKHRPQARFYGIGGPKMQREGFDALWPSEKLSVRGYAEVLRHYREITGIRRRLLTQLLRDKPDIFIGVDGSDFNLWLEKRLKRAGIPTIQFVSPSIWAWRRKRISKIVAAVNHVLALYPFEPKLYEGTPVKCSYVGHPLADVIPLEIDQHAVREKLNLAHDRPIVALLPGSRQSELHYIAETFIEAGKLLLERYPKLIFLVPLVSRETRHQFEVALWKLKAEELQFKLMFGHAAEAVAASDAVLVASGTATLETALVGRPMVIAYKMSPWSWRLMRGMRYLPWVGLPNILAERYVVPEFLQDDATPENLAQAVGNLLADPIVCAGIKRVFGGVHRLLRQDTAQKAADALLPYLSGSNPRVA
jgi:lipid-A-disaccharide synthase